MSRWAGDCATPSSVSRTRSGGAQRPGERESGQGEYRQRKEQPERSSVALRPGAPCSKRRTARGRGREGVFAVGPASGAVPDDGARAWRGQRGGEARGGGDPRHASRGVDAEPRGGGGRGACREPMPPSAGPAGAQPPDLSRAQGGALWPPPGGQRGRVLRPRRGGLRSAAHRDARRGGEGARAMVRCAMAGEGCGAVSRRPYSMLAWLRGAGPTFHWDPQVGPASFWACTSWRRWRSRPQSPRSPRYRPPYVSWVPH